MAMAEPSTRSPGSVYRRPCESSGCRAEIAAIEAELLASNPDVAGLCMALADWSAELRILQDKERRRAGTRRRE